MSKELIEQLPSDDFIKLVGEHGLLHPVKCYSDNELHALNRLEAFAKAYQAAAPIDNVAEALQEIFDLCMKYQRSCYNTGYLHLADDLLNIASKANTLIRVIPDTQAAPIESERE
jgi:hypothetical protein